MSVRANQKGVTKEPTVMVTDPKFAILYIRTSADNIIVIYIIDNNENALYCVVLIKLEYFIAAF